MKTEPKTVDIKTSELSDAALDWAVAICEFDSPVIHCGIVHAAHEYMPFQPSKDWAQGGPIIEREGICVNRRHQCDPAYYPSIHPSVCWVARDTVGGYLSYGPTPLIAAMRCYVALKLGGVVSIPCELVS